ncbi:MAG: hypothetical protein ACKO40_03685 [Planctomycetaceae bacterium]
MRVEELERRLPLAGNVTAEMVGSTLRLSGDNLANDVMVASAAGGRIAVVGIDTTINGKTTAFVTNGAVTSIIANFRGGDDAVGFDNSAADYASQRQFTALATTPETWFEDPAAPFDVMAVQAMIDGVVGGVATFTIPGSLRVMTGAGNDSVGIAGEIGGRVVVRLGPADTGNGILIGSESTPSHIGGGVLVIGAAANDLAVIGNASVAETVSAVLGDGENWMLVAAASTTPAAIGTLAYAGGNGGDTVTLIGDVTIREDACIGTGARGADEVGFYQSDAGDTVKVLGDVAVTTGAGSDQVSIFAATVGRMVRIDTGVGDDAVQIDALEVRGDLVIRLGAGDDSLGVKNLRAATVFLDGGIGTNSLTMDAATQIGARTLKHRRFQVVTPG